MLSMCVRHRAYRYVAPLLADLEESGLPLTRVIAPSVVLAAGWARRPDLCETALVSLKCYSCAVLLCCLAHS